MGQKQLPVRRGSIRNAIIELKEIRRASTMEHSNFNGMFDKINFPKSREEITPFIKERTRIWRESWITEPLDELIKNLEFELNRKI